MIRMLRVRSIRGVIFGAACVWLLFVLITTLVVQAYVGLAIDAQLVWKCIVAGAPAAIIVATIGAAQVRRRGYW